MPRYKHQRKNNPGLGILTEADRVRNDGKPLTPKDLRAILDEFLHPHCSMVVLCRRWGRTRQALEVILFHRIPQDYDEGGRRESLVDKITPLTSSLSPKRKPTFRDMKYLEVLMRPGKLFDDQVVRLLNVTPQTLEQMKEDLEL